MNPDSPLPFSSILMPNRNGTGRPYVLLPSRHRSSWLLPAGSVLGHAGLRSFGYRGAKGFAARALVAAKLLRGQHIWLDSAPLERALDGALGTPDVRLAFCTGTSGAYRKLTVQVRTRGDRVLAYAKIAAHTPAQDSLRREHETLLRLSRVDGLHGAVPAVLGWFSWRDALVLLVTPGSGWVGSGRLMEQHTAFLRRLHDAFAHEARFEASAMWTRVVAAVNRLAPLLPHDWTLRWRRALAQLHAELGPVVLPLSLAHRDFAPWNTRVGPRGLFVFDWETAADGVIPFYDIFHFQAIQAARVGRPFHPSLPPHHVIARPRSGWQACLPQLYLAYLLDMSVLYAEARLLSPRSGHGREWEWFGRHLDAWTEHRRVVA